MTKIITPTGTLPFKLIPAAHNPLKLPLPFSICRLPAGFPSPAQDYIEQFLDLTEHLVRNKTATFYFRVAGWSMRDAGIEEDDILVVDRSIGPRHGHIVVATVDGDFTVKKLYRRAGVVELRPANPDFKPIEFSDGQELVIWGVVTSIVRKLQA
ncbi:LexA family protein [Oxalicibacterium faecigallinarum]|uniref:UmuD protein n=1 Tax=Oxalicibacterium faecigallinarum TaxID=573741 RepID=A0A8J3AMF5_9BURK|nr:translesion error-prone DNA polymerase V autoproteolytic subunit [Oxalicibacterium faecigallinarum]GGI16480.1 umuD protein [Oxalicibacterium faecigallinarum]